MSVVVFCRVLQNHDDKGKNICGEKRQKVLKKWIHTINISGLVFLTHKFDSAVIGTIIKGSHQRQMFHQLLTTVHEFYKPPTKCHQCGINVSNQWQTIHVFDNTVTKFSRHCLTNTLSLRVPHHITSKTFLCAEVFFERKRWHLTDYKDCCANIRSYIWLHQFLFWYNTENANI